MLRLNGSSWVNEDSPYDVGMFIPGTFATAGGGAETFAAGDRLAIINEDPADATLADLSITFLGKRT